MNSSTEQITPSSTKLPSWFRQEIPDVKKISEMKNMFRASNLHTVCESARCPNMGTCWGRGVATFMISGDICTRACRFCSVSAGRPAALDREEPRHIAEVIQKMNLRYVVITSVARDDLPDEGAGHFAQTISEVRKLNPQIKIEVLIPDFSAQKEHLKTVADAGPEVISHNIETVNRLSKKIRPQAEYLISLKVLKMIQRLNPSIFVKSSFMVGLGETMDEIIELMNDLREAGCQILTIGQYLAPTQMKRHVRVERFVTPAEFENYKQLGVTLGFKHVMSGPLVRSSYIAEEGYQECLKGME
ncbi:MAG TPA: lipoyl synthase [Candidatus Omnitrophota bacterium]|nr:lipoyl synthase [Candidatus Omnitrophota bacterium]